MLKSNIYCSLVVLSLILFASNCLAEKNDKVSLELDKCKKNPFLIIEGYVEPTDSYMPPSGYIPNKTVAIKVAKIILKEIYGEAEIEEQTPFKACLKEDVWKVEGILHKKPGFITKGGVAELHIDRFSGEIKRVRHGK